MKRTIVVAALLGLVACGGADPAVSTRTPLVTKDLVGSSFAFQLADLHDATASLVYTWQNPGTMAALARSSVLSAGTVRLRITDGAQPPVLLYNGLLNDQTGSVYTYPGTPGTWTVEVDAAGATGTIDFRLSKAP